MPDIELQVTGTGTTPDVLDQRPEDRTGIAQQRQPVALQQRETEDGFAEACQRLHIDTRFLRARKGTCAQGLLPLAVASLDGPGTPDVLAADAVFPDKQVDQHAHNRNAEDEREPCQQDADRAPPHDYPH